MSVGSSMPTMDNSYDQQSMRAGSGGDDEPSSTNDSDLGRLLMDGKVVGTMDEDGIMRYKLTSIGRIATEAEMADYIEGMCRSKVWNICDDTNKRNSPL